MKKIAELQVFLKIPVIKKTIRTMKITGLLLMLFVTSVYAGKTYSQTKVLNLKANNVTVKEVLNEIEDQSEFYFMYSGKLIDVERKVSININEKKIDYVLKKLFAGTDVNYAVR